jgi:hypothetical protein
MGENFPGAFAGYTLQVIESHQKTKVRGLDLRFKSCIIPGWIMYNLACLLPFFIFLLLLFGPSPLYLHIIIRSTRPGPPRPWSRASTSWGFPSPRGRFKRSGTQTASSKWGCPRSGSGEDVAPLVPFFFFFYLLLFAFVRAYEVRGPRFKLSTFCGSSAFSFKSCSSPNDPSSPLCFLLPLIPTAAATRSTRTG